MNRADSLNHLFFHDVRHPFGLLGCDFFYNAIDLIAQALDLTVPLRKYFACCKQTIYFEYFQTNQ